MRGLWAASSRPVVTVPMALRTFKPRNVAHGALLRNALLDGRVLSLVRSLQLPAASSRGDLAYTRPHAPHMCVVATVTQLWLT